MIAPDTSVLIAGSDPTHVHFTQASAGLAEVRRDGVLIAHTLAETFAVLTAAAYRRAPPRVCEYLAQFLDRPPAGLRPERYPEAIAALAAAGVTGGAVYDGLIALAARDAGAVLVSLDRRAAAIYARCGLEHRILSA